MPCQIFNKNKFSNRREQIAPFVESSCKDTMNNFLSVAIRMYSVITYIISELSVAKKRISEIYQACVRISRNFFDLS